MFFNSSDEGIFSARRCIQIQRGKKKKKKTLGVLLDGYVFKGKTFLKEL
jgi:hypothetical protein